MSFTTIPFYKYIDLENPEQIRLEQLDWCQKYNLKGGMTLGKEGVNSTFEGSCENIQGYIETMAQNPI